MFGLASAQLKNHTSYESYANHNRQNLRTKINHTSVGGNPNSLMVGGRSSRNHTEGKRMIWLYIVEIGVSFV